MSKLPSTPSSSFLSLIQAIESKSQSPSGPIFPHQIQQLHVQDSQNQLKRIREYVERMIITQE